MELVELPYYREQLRWALACYRHNNQIGVPTLRLEIIKEVGEERVERELSKTDLYNFLQHGAQTRPFKLKIIEEFLQSRAPDYVRAMEKQNFLTTFADFLERFSLPSSAASALQDTHTGQALSLANKTFVAEDGGSPFWPSDTDQAKGYEEFEEQKSNWLGLKASKVLKRKINTENGKRINLACMSFRLLPNRRHLQFLTFNVDIDVDLVRPHVSAANWDDHPRRKDIEDNDTWRRQLILNAAIEAGQLHDQIAIRNLYTGVLTPSVSPHEFIGIGRTVDYKSIFLTVAIKHPGALFDDAYWVSVRAINGQNLGAEELASDDPLENFMTTSSYQRENTEITFVDELIASAGWSMQ